MNISFLHLGLVQAWAYCSAFLLLVDSDGQLLSCDHSLANMLKSAELIINKNCIPNEFLLTFSIAQSRHNFLLRLIFIGDFKYSLFMLPGGIFCLFAFQCVGELLLTTQQTREERYVDQSGHVLVIKKSYQFSGSKLLGYYIKTTMITL